MTICGNRPDEPVGFFTPCWRCLCGDEVRAEQAEQEESE